jgi:hypothetical protein
MLTAKGAVPMILTIILVQRISYISPVSPDKKKQTRTNRAILPVELYGAFFSSIYFFSSYEGQKLAD